MPKSWVSRSCKPQQRGHQSYGTQIGRAAIATATVVAIAGSSSVGTAASQQLPSESGTSTPAATAQSIPELIAAVARASEDLEAARIELAGRKESVNKSLVDFQLARIELDRANEHAARTIAVRELADSELALANEKLNNLSRIIYRQGMAPGALANLTESHSPNEALIRSEYLRRAASDQEQVVGELVETSDRAKEMEDHAAQAQAAAQEKMSLAESQRDGALSQIANVAGEVESMQQQSDGKEAQLRQAKDALDAVRAGPTTRPQNIEAPTTWENSANTNVARTEALARLASSPEVDRLAQNIASAIPAYLDNGVVPSIASGSVEGEGTGLIGDAASEMLQEAIADEFVNILTTAIASGSADSAGPGDPTPIPSVTTSNTTTTSTPAPSDTDEPDNSDSDANIEVVIDRAMSQLGVPYAWGGGNAQGPSLGIRDWGVADMYGDFTKIGFDCSGLMIYAFAGAGKVLSHFSGYQYTSGRQIPTSDIKRGDMLFWGHGGSNHVALYLGGGKMIEAPESGSVVKISPVRWGGMTQMAVRMIG